MSWGVRREFYVLLGAHYQFNKFEVVWVPYIGYNQQQQRQLVPEPLPLGGQELPRHCSESLGLDVLCLLQQLSFPFSCGHRMSAAGSFLCLPAGSFEDETLRIAGPFSG